LFQNILRRIKEQVLFDFDYYKKNVRHAAAKSVKKMRLKNYHFGSEGV
jgi:hypothetical protein